MPWRTLFAAALVISHEMALERATYTYSFVSLMLRRFGTAEEWSHAKDTIIMASEQFECGSIRLPFLDMTSRAAAKKERRKWLTTFRQLSEKEPRHSERVGVARRYILERLSFMFMPTLI